MCRLALLLFCISVTGLVASDAGQGYRYFNQSDVWVKFHSTPTTWKQANRICQQEGAVLASQDLKLMTKAMSLSDNDLHMIHTANLPTESHEGEEPQALAMENTGEMKRVSQYKLLPFVCSKKGSERPLVDICGENGYVLDSITQHCYKFHRSRKTWYDASFKCSSEGGYLAVINSAIEAQVIRDIFADNPANYINYEPGHIDFRDVAFIGVRAANYNEPRKWITIKGQSLSAAGYEVWARGEPNNVRGDEHCMSINRQAKMQDNPCSGRLFSYFCEKETINY